MSKLIGFILGKNPDLSRAEIASYLYGRNISFSEIAFEKQFLVLDFDSDFVPKIDDLGGCIKIFLVNDIFTDSLEEIDIKKYFNLNQDFIKFGMSFYNIEDWKDLYEELSGEIKSKLREEKIKVGVIHLRGNTSYLEHLDVINKKLIDRGEIIVCFSGNKYYAGKTVQVHNPLEFQKRDVKRPAQRPIFSIPPRLAKIMINLLEIKEGVILDTFCGIGGILQEVALMGFDIRGVDIDPDCVLAARKNLEWIEREYKIKIGGLENKIIHGDSRKLSTILEKESIDGVATEPYMGPPLRGIPPRGEAQKILSELEGLYKKTLSEIYKVLKPSGKVCIISPRIRMGNSEMGMDMKKISRAAGFVLLKRFTDSEERHKIVREINVLGKMA